ncbi:unnamed protein product, partial [Rotaria sordida]
MPNQRTKTGVTVVPVSRKHIYSGIRRKQRRETLSNNSNLEAMKSMSIPFDLYESETNSSTLINPSIIEMQEISSIDETNITHPRSSSLNKSLTLSKNDDTSRILSRIESVKEYQNQKPNRRSHQYTNPIIERKLEKSSKNIENNEGNKRNRRRRIGTICSACSNCCCISTIIGILLLLFGI